MSDGHDPAVAPAAPLACSWCEKHGFDGTMGADERPRRCPECRRHRQEIVALKAAGSEAVAIAAQREIATVHMECAIERERHVTELDALACDLVPTPPIRDAVAAWIKANPDTGTLRRLAERLGVDAGYLSRLIGRSRMQDTEVDGHRARGAFRREMPLEDAERIVRAIGLAPVQLREHGL